MSSRASRDGEALEVSSENIGSSTNTTSPAVEGFVPRQPSVLYRASLWRASVAVARRMPHFFLCRLAGHVAKVYWLSCPQRRRVVFQNVLPAVHGDRRAAAITTRELFQQFAFKLADLWRY